MDTACAGPAGRDAGGVPRAARVAWGVVVRQSSSWSRGSGVVAVGAVDLAVIALVATEPAESVAVSALALRLNVTGGLVRCMGDLT